MKKNIENFKKLIEYIMNETLMNSFKFLHKINRNNKLIILYFYFSKNENNSTIKTYIKAIDDTGKNWIDDNNFDLTEIEISEIFDKFINKINNLNIQKINS